MLFPFLNGKMNDDNDDDESKGENTLTSSTAEVASKNRQKVCKRKQTQNKKIGNF